MAWQQLVTDTLANGLRFFIRAAILVNGIALSLGSVYVMGKLIWFSIQFLDRTIFSKPW